MIDDNIQYEFLCCFTTDIFNEINFKFKIIIKNFEFQVKFSKISIFKCLLYVGTALNNVLHCIETVKSIYSPMQPQTIKQYSWKFFVECD